MAERSPLVSFQSATLSVIFDTLSQFFACRFLSDPLADRDSNRIFAV